MFVTDLEGKEYATMITTEKTDEINGNIIISADFEPTKANNVFLNNLSEFWLFTDSEGVEYKIVMCKTFSKGGLPFKRVRMIPKAFDELDTTRVYERYTGSYGMDELMKIIFENTPYTYRVMGTWNAIRIEGFGDGDTCLKMLGRIMQRYNAEFEFTGNSFTIRDKIGTDTEIMYRYKLNASNINKEVDGQEYWTFMRGWGDYDADDSGDMNSDKQGWESAKLKRSYTSPLAKIIGIRHGPPIRNGAIKLQSKMDENLKTNVDNSIKISVEASLTDLSSKYYPQAQAQLGDLVWLMDERIGFNEKVRVVKRTVKKDWKGEILNISYTLGSQGMVDRYSSQLSNAVKEITDILEGRKKLPFQAMSDEIQIVTKLLKSVQTQLTVDEQGGLLAIDKKNPNLIVLLNAAGIGISDDGGKTFKNALTGRGLMADAIIANSITADKLAANAITVGFNNSSTNLKLYSDRIQFFSNNRLTAELDDRGMTFWYGSRQIGDLGEGQKLGNSNVRGINMRLHSQGDYVSWSHLKNVSDTSYTVMLTMDPYGRMTGWRGIDASMPMRVVDNQNYTHELHHALQVGSAFKGLHLEIPSRISSDGQIQQWYNFDF